MNERTKKILLIVGFLAAIIILAFAIYYLFFRPIITPPAPVVPPTNAPPTGLPTAPPALNLPPTALNLPPTIPQIPAILPTPIVPGPIVSYKAIGGITAFQTLETDVTSSPALAANGQDLLYYDTNTGFIYNVTPDGQKKLFSDTPFKNVDKITWAPNKQKVVLEYPDGSKIIYDFNQKKSITLPSQWKDFTFSNDNNQIAFKDMRLDPANRYISIADTNGSSYRQIEPLGDEDNDVHISWSPNNKYIALYRESVDGDTADVYPIGFNGENFQKFTVEGRDLRFAWSPSGNELVYSVYNSRSNYNPALWVVNTNPDLLGTGRNSLGIQTWADKCVFAAEDTVYCAVPKTLDTGTGFRPDLADNTPDDIYKINISTGAKQLAAQPLYPTTIENLIVSSDGKYIYWLEKNTGQIKKMNL